MPNAIEDTKLYSKYYKFGPFQICDTKNFSSRLLPVVDVLYISLSHTQKMRTVSYMCIAYLLAIGYSPYTHKSSSNIVLYNKYALDVYQCFVYCIILYWTQNSANPPEYYPILCECDVPIANAFGPGPTWARPESVGLPTRVDCYRLWAQLLHFLQHFPGPLFPGPDFALAFASSPNRRAKGRRQVGLKVCRI